MKITATVLVALFASTLSLSSAEAAENTDYFQRLSEMYQRGSIPTKAEIVGWNAGRCFYDYAHNAVVPSLLIGELAPSEGNGPLFPAESLRFIALFNSKARPDAFDNWTPTLDTAMTDIIRSSIGMNALLGPAEVVEDALSINYASWAVIWRLRMVDNYIVLKFTHHGDEMAYCYYFKRIK